MRRIKKIRGVKRIKRLSRQSVNKRANLIRSRKKKTSAVPKKLLGRKRRALKLRKRLRLRRRIRRLAPTGTHQEGFEQAYQHHYATGFSEGLQIGKQKIQ